MRNICICFIALFVLSPWGWAQTVIHGRVTTAAGDGVEGFVTASALGTNTILQFARTDTTGQYRLEVTTADDSLDIQATGLAFVPYGKVVANRSQELNLLVEEKKNRIQEVTVKAQKIQQNGDTVNYHVAAFAQQNDRVIGDVLRRMPGIEVGPTGMISYYGRPIRKFYVENKDLLQGRYGIATNNINAQDVATVQVMENNQPIKLLRMLGYGGDVAINLKLKDSAKGTFSLSAMAGGGWQKPSGEVGRNPLWQAELVGMYFNRRNQHISLYKGDESGNDVVHELDRFYASTNSVALNPICPVGVVSPSNGGLPPHRSMDNVSHIATVNHLTSIDTVSETNFNMAYQRMEYRQEGNSTSEWYVGEGLRQGLRERLTQRDRQNRLDGQARYERNGSIGYLNNVVQVSSSWNDNDVRTDMGYWQHVDDSHEQQQRQLHQQLEVPSWRVSNTLNLMRSRGRHVMDLHLSGGYVQQSASLEVQQEGNDLPQMQDFTDRAVAVNAHTKYRYRKGKFSLAYTLSVYADLHHIESDLQMSGNDGLALLPRHNDLWYKTGGLHLTQTYRYGYRHWSVDLACPVSLFTESIDNLEAGHENSHTRVVANPSLTIAHEGKRWYWAMSSHYNQRVGGTSNIYPAWVMTNYRTYRQTYSDRLWTQRNAGASTSLRYKDVLNVCAFRVNAGCGRSWNNQLLGYEYRDAVMLVHRYDQANQLDHGHADLYLEKGFDWLNSMFRLSAGYDYSEHEQVVNDMLYGYRLHNKSVGLDATLSLAPRVRLAWHNSCVWSKCRLVHATGYDQKMLAANLNGSLHYDVTKQLTLSTIVEDIYNNQVDRHRHAWFADLRASLKVKHVQYDLQLNNLFNLDEYTRINYSGMDIYSNTCQLRPVHVLLNVRFKLL